MDLVDDGPERIVIYPERDAGSGACAPAASTTGLRAAAPACSATVCAAASTCSATAAIAAIPRFQRTCLPRESLICPLLMRNGDNRPLQRPNAAAVSGSVNAAAVS